MLDEEQREIEDILLSLEPKFPSELLSDRIGLDIREGERVRDLWVKPLLWVSGITVLAACLTAMFFSGVERNASPVFEVRALEESVLSVSYPAPDRFTQVGKSSSLVESTEGPVYIDEEGVAVREIYLRYLDTKVLERLGDGTVITVSSYREESLKVRSKSY